MMTDKPIRVELPAYTLCLPTSEQLQRMSDEELATLAGHIELRLIELAVVSGIDNIDQIPKLPDVIRDECQRRIKGIQ